MNKYESLIAKLEKEGAHEVIQIACDEHVPGFEGVSLWNGETFYGECWSHNTRSGDDGIIEVWRVTDGMLDGEEADPDLFDERHVCADIVDRLRYTV